MARVFIDGFESGDLGLWDGSAGASVTAAQSGMDGNYNVYINTTNNAHVAKNVPASSEYYVAFRFRSTSTLTNVLMAFYNSSTVIGTLTLGSNLFSARLGSYSGTILATGTTSINTDTTYLIEVYLKAADSGGRWVVKVNGVTDIDYTGDTTPGPTTIDNICFGTKFSGTCCYAYYDNIVIDNASFPGQTCIQGIKPTAAGNSTQWNPSSGSNWDCVDEIPANDNDYVSTNSNGALDLYIFSDLTGSIEEVKCVQLQARTIKNGAPTPQNLQLAVRSGGTNYFSSSMAVPYVNPKSLFNIWQLNPNTSAAWTVSEVNAAEFGMNAVA